MNVYITLDYELFFGSKLGSIERSILYPSAKLIEIGKKHQVGFTFFIDVGYLLQLKEKGQNYPHLLENYHQITSQIRELVANKHDCQLHIHPHWERASFDGENWTFDYDYYKLSDFDEKEIESIFDKYTEELKSITQQTISCFRAGGWCIQPFEKVQKSFVKHQIKLDSSVFVGGKNLIPPYHYDFTKVPKKACWNFSKHECVEDKDGLFTELPISSYRYSPLFFWKLFVLGNLIPSKHKPIGDGIPMPAPQFSRKKLLTQFHTLSASVDGYFVSKMRHIIAQNQQKGYNHTVFIGHPKALSEFSIEQLDRFITTNKEKYRFITCSDYLNEI